MSRKNTVKLSKRSLGEWLFALLALLLLAVFIDRTFVRPREPIDQSDKATLRSELVALSRSTESRGSWVDEQTVDRSTFVLSSTFVGQAQDAPLLLIMTGALSAKGWHRTEGRYQRALVTYCKGRYRAEVFSGPSPLHLKVSFTVKELLSDANCLSS